VSGALLALERAVHLSASGVARGRRLLAAAELAAEAGRSAVARAWLDRSRSLLTDPRDRLRAEVVAEVVDESMQGGAARVDALIGMSERALREGEEDVAVRLVLGAARRCWHMDFGADVERRVVTAADRARGDRRDPRLVLVRAFASPFDRAAAVVAELHHRLPAPDDDPADLLMLGFAGACVGAYSEAEVFCAAAATALREQGRLALLAEALSLLTWATLRRGRWQVASPAADECVRLSREIGQPIQEAAGLAAQAMIAGIRGDDGADELAAQAEALATATRNTIGLAVTCLARGVIAAGQGRPEQSFEHLWRLYQPSDPAHQRMQACRSLGHLAEVAVATGHVGEARVELARFEPLAAATPAEGVHVAVGYARAVLAGPEAADDAFAAALDRNWGDWSFEHGRLLLAYGGWLRRHQRVRESRVHLRGALDEFVRAGARPWAERARRELRAAGEASVALRGDAWERLSPQEAQIARLVLEGLGNKEIGQRLYLSHRTVGSHLYRMFPKVGVSSRAQLVHLLAQAPVEDE
jgi:DNA-binding CsgD family transcriptional regulator